MVLAQSITVGKARWREQGAAGHMTSVSGSRERSDAEIQLAFSFFISPDPSSTDGVAHIQDGSSQLS